MPRYVYVNGSYVPHSYAYTHIEDRGFQFADGVYEVIGCIHGHLADETGHLDRLERSLKEIQMPMPVSRASLKFIMRELLRRNRHRNGYLYIQITRGVAKRDFQFPHENTKQTLVITSRAFNFETNINVLEGIKVITTIDTRWKRPDIKSVALLPQVLAKQEAVEKGAYEAWMLDENGFITEGSASNAWILTTEGNLVTRKASGDILRGVTRTALNELLNDLQINLEVRNFTPQEAYEAQEAFTSSATALIMPVIEIDGHKIGSGKPGPIARQLYKEYRAYIDGLRGEQVRWEA